MFKTALTCLIAAALAALAACAADKPSTSTNTAPVKVGQNMYSSESKFGKIVYSLRRDPAPGSTHLILRCEESSTGTCIVVAREPGRGDNVLKRLRMGEEMHSAAAQHEFVFCVQPLVADYPLQVVCLPKPAEFQ